MKNKLYYRFFPQEYKSGITEHLLKHNHKKNLVGCEIGVGNGINALNMLKYLPIKTFYLIDPYEPFFEENILVTDYCNLFNEANKRLRNYKENIKFIKKFVCNTIDDIPDDLDFVWFDASGDYNVVKSFLNDYFPKLIEGGILGGKRFNSNWFGVCHAALEFVNGNDLELFGCNSGDWWFVKK